MMVKKRIQYLVILVFCCSVFQLPTLANDTIYRTYINDDIGAWKAVIYTATDKEKLSNEEMLSLVNLYYGYSAWCIDKGKSTEADRSITKALELLDKLENSKYELSSVYAYKGVFYGFIITMSFLKAPVYGYKCFNYSEKAMETDTTNVMGLIQMGNIKFYVPKFLGGSKPEAFQYYESALNVMEQEMDKAMKDWNYLHLLATIVFSYVEIEEYEKAKYYCEKGLQIAPEFRWLKDEMYPEIQKHLLN